LKFIPYKPTPEDLEKNPHYQITSDYLERLYSTLERPSSDIDPQAAEVYDEVMEGCGYLLSLGLYCVTAEARHYMFHAARHEALHSYMRRWKNSDPNGRKLATRLLTCIA
jgi:hypothetical protein